MLTRGALIRAALIGVVALALAGCGAAEVPGHGTSDSRRTSGAAHTTTTTKATLSANAGRTLPLPPSGELNRHEVTGKVGRVDALPAAAKGGGYIAPGAPSDAQIKAEIAQARKAGIILPKGDSA